jgi:hypothetical protein
MPFISSNFKNGLLIVHILNLSYVGNSAVASGELQSTHLYLKRANFNFLGGIAKAFYGRGQNNKSLVNFY